MSPTIPDEPIEMRFGRLSRVGPRNHVLDGDRDHPTGRGNFLGVVRPTEKRLESLLRCTLQKKSFHCQRLHEAKNII